MLILDKCLDKRAGSRREISRLWSDYSPNEGQHPSCLQCYRLNLNIKLLALGTKRTLSTVVF